MQVVISDIPGCGGWEYAAAHGIPTEVYPASAKAIAAGSQALSAQELVTAVKELYAVDFVLLAGYLKVGTGDVAQKSPVWHVAACHSCGCVWLPVSCRRAAAEVFCEGARLNFMPCFLDCTCLRR